MKEQQIYDILRHHKIPLKKRELIIDDLKEVLESKQKEFEEYMNNRIKDLENLDKHDDFSGELHVLSEALTKYKELNK